MQKIETIMPASRPSSSISQAMRGLQADIGGPAKWNFSSKLTQKFRILAASNRANRERAYRLACRVYKRLGYTVADDTDLIVADYDARPETMTLLVEDEAGKEIATITSTGDSRGLPCDEIFSEELDSLRAKGRRLTEVTRLAIVDNHQNCKEVLVYLINFLFVNGVRNQHYTDCVIEVNPRHVAFYQRLLAFKQLGPERPCPRANGAPAVLLHLDLEIYDQEVRRVGGTHNPACRSLYSYFHTTAEEVEIAGFLARTHAPMTVDEMRYFNLTKAVARAESESLLTDEDWLLELSPRAPLPLRSRRALSSSGAAR